MLSSKNYRELYDELTNSLKGLGADSKALYSEIWLQKSVLNAEMAIAAHGRGVVISNLKELVNSKIRLWDIASKELFVLESCEHVEWET